MKNRAFVFASIAFVLLAVSLGLAQRAPHKSPVVAVLPDKPLIAPQVDRVWTATREVTSLQFAPDGTLWAGTNGGVLRRDTRGAWRKWTRRDGLPSHEVRALQIGKEITIGTPRGNAVFDGKNWRATKTKAPATPSTQAKWRGKLYTANPEALSVSSGGKKSQIALPPSSGTHISALLGRSDGLWAAFYGDGLWKFDGRSWKRALQIPMGAREITSLSARGKTLALGTRRAGIWLFDGARWSQWLQPNEPFDHNIQFIDEAGGALLCTTLEDGLVSWNGKNWNYLWPQLSSNAPRQMARFRGALWLRHGGGRIDRWNGTQWVKNVFPKLPRGRTSALAADSTHLYLGQWGGWSEWDGKSFRHFLGLPELQGVPVLSLLPDGETLWIGTQSKGVGEWHYATRKLTWHDERAGVPDDWITSLARAGKTLYAGTFVGGLARWDAGQWRTVKELEGQNVTALEPDGDAIWIATRIGVGRIASDGTFRFLKLPLLDPENQALHRVPGGLFIGARTGLSFVSNASLKSALKSTPE